MSVYLVTGAAGGMGKEVCRRLSEQGHRVFGLDRALPIGEAAETTADPASQPRFFRADLTKPEDLEAAVKWLRTQTETLDGIIHTAGVYDLNSLIEMPEEDFVRDYSVNLFGAFRVNRAFAPFLHEGARLVFVTSELAPLHPLPFTGIYAATKTALEKYAEALRMEVQLLGWTVILIRPGAVRTGMLPESTRKLDEFVENTEHYPVNAGRFRKIVGRVEARNVPPEKVAGLIGKALAARRPRLTYTVNRNPLLLLLNALPKRLQLFIIRKILE